jgi:hypothetical protein
MKTTKDDALNLSKKFRELSVALGNYRFDNWGNLTASQRQQLEDQEWTLLNHASDLTTLAVGIALDETQASLSNINGSITKAKKAVKKLDTVRKIIKVAESGVRLAAAIVTKDPKAIAKASKDLYQNATA